MELQTDTTEQVTHIHTPLHDPALWFTSALYYFQTWFCPPQQEGMYQFPAYYLSVPNPRLWSWNISPLLSDMTVISVRRKYGRDPGGGKVSPPGTGCFLLSAPHSLGWRSGNPGKLTPREIPEECNRAPQLLSEVSSTSFLVTVFLTKGFLGNSIPSPPLGIFLMNVCGISADSSLI